MTREPGRQIGFVDLLYAVLAGVILQRLSLTALIDNLARGFTVVLLLEDYLAFHNSTIIAGRPGRVYRPPAFIVDLAILALWFLAYLGVEAHRFAVWFLSLGSFFLLKAAWEIVSYPEIRNWHALYRTHAPLALAAFGLSALLPTHVTLAVLAITWLVFTPIWWTIRVR